MISVPVLLICLSSAVYAAEDSLSTDGAGRDSYSETLIKKARSEKLWEEPEWITFLHYDKSFFGFKSRVDDPQFFFFAEGKYDPEKEMYATINAMFGPETDDSNRLYKFTARYNWLKTRLSIDETKLNDNFDKKFSTFYDNYKPVKVTLVFPAGYMNNPASMFGHTFLLLESEDSSKLLAQSANYAAITNETAGPIYWFKGFFGMYPGYYSFVPYYKKVQEYNDAEMRDMWEYELDLSGDDIRTVMRHVVEMENIYSDYYFLDENCSFNLLYLIQAAKPQTNLTDSFAFGVEPVDTLRVVRNKNLVLKRVYRPSMYSKIKYLRSLLNDDEEELVLNVCNGTQDISDMDKLNLSDERKTIICDLCSEYLKFMVVKKTIQSDDYRSRFMSVLKYRNNLPVIDNFRDIPEPAAPEDGHGSSRIGLQGGNDVDGWYTELSYRRTCHELMDPDEGYNFDSQIVLGKVSGRYYYEEKKFTLQSFDFVDVLSLPVTDSFNVSKCYNFRLAIVRNPVEDGWVHSFNLKGAGGYSTLLWSLLHVYAMAGGNSFFADDYKYNMDLQLGCETGIITILGPWKNHLWGKAYMAPLGTEHTILSAGASERITFNRYFAVIGDINWVRDFNKTNMETSLKACFYF